MKPRWRTGFNLIELLIVISIIGVLMAVMIPAVQRVREAANRTQCANNLKQISTAIHAYHDTNSALPPGRMDPYGGVTWAVLVLPFLGQEPFGARWNPHNWYYVHSPETRQTQVKAYFCPARRVPGGDMISNQGDMPEKGPWSGTNPPFQPPFFGALGDYAACAGDNSPGHLFSGPNANGSMILGSFSHANHSPPFVIKESKSRTRFDTLTDGSSTTFLLGEKHVPSGKFGREQDGDGAFYNGDAFNLNAARVAGVGYPIARTADEPFKLNFGSYHPGVCQFVMVDGSLRPIRTSITGFMLSALAVGNDGRTIVGDIP